MATVESADTSESAERAELGSKLHNPVEQPSGRSRSKRLLLSQHEHIVHVCEQIEELSIVFHDQVDACREMDVPIALLLCEVTNFDNMKDAFGEPAGEVVVQQVAQSLLNVMRGQDVIAQYAKRYVAVLLVDADQVVAAKVSQRIKECVHRYSYFHHGGGSIDLVFGVSDDSGNRYVQLESLIFSAASALRVASDRGGGAVVRTSDMDPNEENHPKEHFLPGDRLTSERG